MKLHEIAKLVQQEKAQLDANPSNTAAWLTRMGIRNFTIRPDGVVDVDDSVDLSRKNLTVIPVQFGNVAGDFFIVTNPQLASLKGCPHTVGGGFSCSNTKISSLDYVPQVILDGDLFCEQNNVISLHNIGKMIQELNGSFNCNKKSTHILGLLQIKGISLIDVDNGGPIDAIMNKYIGKGSTAIISAQDELMDAGFYEQARS